MLLAWFVFAIWPLLSLWVFWSYVYLESQWDKEDEEDWEED